MAFRASNVVPQQAYQQVKGAAWQLRINLIGAITQLEQRSIDFNYIQGLYLAIKNASGQLEALKVTPGLAEYAKSQEDDPSYNIGAEFSALQAAISDAIVWMNNAVPGSVSVKPPSTWDDISGVIATEFSPAQTKDLRTILQVIVDAVS